MPTLRYIGNAPTRKTIVSATDDGERAHSKTKQLKTSARSNLEQQPPGDLAVRLCINNNYSAANREDTSVMNIVKKVNRLSLDPSKGAGRSDSTVKAGEQVSEKENLNQTSYSDLRSPTKSPYTKATKRHEKQQASKIKSDIFRLAIPTVPSRTLNVLNIISNPIPSNLFMQPTDKASQNATHPFAESTPHAFSYSEVQSRYLQYSAAPVTENGGCNQLMMNQPSHAASDASAQIYFDCSSQGQNADITEPLQTKAILYESHACNSSITNIASSTKDTGLLNQMNRTTDLNTSTCGSSGALTTQPMTTSSKSTSSTTKQKKIKDPNAPKRSKSAFMFYQMEMRPFIKEEFPGISFGDTSKIIGLRWKSLESEQKRKYHIMAMNDRERYYKELAHEAKLCAEKCNLNSTGR